MKNLLGTFLTILALATLTGCTSISVKSSWKAPDAAAGKYGRFLVVGIAAKPQMRQVFEEVFASEMSKRGMNALASYSFTGVKETPNRESLQNAVNKSTADAVITTRVVHMKKDTDVRTGFIMTDRGYTNTNFAGADVYPADIFGFYGASVSYASFEHKSVEITMSTEATIETNLFDAKTGRLVWSATSSAVDPEGIINITKELTDKIIKALTKDGLI